MVVKWWGWGEYRLSFLMVHTKGEKREVGLKAVNSQISKMESDSTTVTKTSGS